MEPNIANPEDVEKFIHELAKLYIAEYISDLAPNDPGYFTRHVALQTDASKVERDFFDNWNEYKPAKAKIVQVQHKTIGFCSHVRSIIIPYDDEFQIRVCKKIREIFSDFAQKSHISEEEYEYEMDVEESTPPVVHMLLSCQIHTSTPQVPRYDEFMKEYSERMFANFLAGVPFQRKKLLYIAADEDRLATMGDDYHHLNYELIPLYNYLRPTIHQTRSMMQNIYGYRYNLLESHIIHHDIGFKHRITQRLTQKIRSYLLHHAEIFKPTK